MKRLLLSRVRASHIELVFRNVGFFEERGKLEYSEEDHEGGYQIPVPSRIFVQIPVTKSEIPFPAVVSKLMRTMISELTDLKALVDALWIRVPSPE